MPTAFELLDSMETEEGVLQLRRRGTSDFMISVGGKVLMTSAITSTELALAQQGCRRISNAERPRVLIGGLGLGFTLRAALDELPPSAVLHVAELNPKVAEWCCGPAASVSGEAALDRRVKILLIDVVAELRRIAEDEKLPRFDAILWDLYEGPTRRVGDEDPLYGVAAVESAHRALQVGGVFGVWGEQPSPAFENRLKKQGFRVEFIPTTGRGIRHAIYLATKLKPRRPRKDDGLRRRKPRRRR